MAEVTVPGFTFEVEDEQRLRSALSAATDDAFKAALARLAHAAVLEYSEMIAGSPMPSRADEMRQHRLLHLITVFYGAIPSESEVGSIFQLTASQSRTLIRSTLARYRHALRPYLEERMKKTFEGQPFQRQFGAFHIPIDSDYVVDALNELLISQPKYVPVRKVRDTSCLYAVTKDTYNEVIAPRLGLPVEK